MQKGLNERGKERKEEAKQYHSVPFKIVSKREKAMIITGTTANQNTGIKILQDFDLKLEWDGAN